jgi:hypothetical protein
LSISNCQQIGSCWLSGICEQLTADTKFMTRLFSLILLLLFLVRPAGLVSRFTPAATAVSPTVQETAQTHHERGVAFHNRRSLDEASREYAAALALDPPRDLSADEWRLVRRFAPRLYVQPSEFFPLKDFAVIVHPSKRLIAYHLFWEDDIDFPEDNDPCDHELMWVQFAADRQTIEKFWSYFHGNLLESGAQALLDARQHGQRPRINVQWGKHGSLLVGWEELTVPAGANAASGSTITLRQYNERDFQRLSQQGRRLAEHPLGQRLGWPLKFKGTWNDFINYARLVDPLTLLNKTKLAKVTRWNNATLDQYFLPYNFRPKTEWPVPEP